MARIYSFPRHTPRRYKTEYEICKRNDALCARLTRYEQ